MSNLSQLDEALSFLNVGNIEIIEEGKIFSKIKNLFAKGGRKLHEKLPSYIYIAYSKPENIGKTINTYWNSIGPTDAINTFVLTILKFGCMDYGKVKIFKKYEDKLNQEELYLYKCKVLKKSKDREFTVKIEAEVFSGSVVEALKKYQVKYTIVDTSNIEKERKAIRAKAIKIATQVIKEAKALPEWDECYTVCDDAYIRNNYDWYEEDIESWNVGIINELDVIEYSIEDHKDGSRVYISDPNCEKMFAFVFDEFYDRIKKELPGVSVDYYGDWDVGPIVILVDNQK